MRRKIAIVLLALGTVVGYGSGIAHAVRWHHAHGECARWHHDGQQQQQPQRGDPQQP